jgi:flavodoxin
MGAGFGGYTIKVTYRAEAAVDSQVGSMRQQKRMVMVNTLVVYYSRTGHNAQMAEQLHAQLPGDLDQIVDTKNREGMFGCVLAAMMRAKTKIQFGKDPAAYDQVVVVSPLWAGSLPPATRTYLAQQGTKFNKFAFMSVCGLGEENKNALKDITTTAKQQPIVSLLVKEEEVENEVTKQKYGAFLAQLPH